MPEQVAQPQKDQYDNTGSGPVKTIMLDDTHIVQVQNRRSVRIKDQKVFAGLHVTVLGGFKTFSIELPPRMTPAMLAGLTVALAEASFISMEDLADALEEKHSKPTKK